MARDGCRVREREKERERKKGERRKWEQKGGEGGERKKTGREGGRYHTYVSQINHWPSQQSSKIAVLGSHKCLPGLSPP